MRRWKVALSALALIAGVLPLAGQQAGWGPFSSPDGRFSLRMPEPPHHSTEQVSDPRLPAPLTSHTLRSIDGRRYFVISYVDYPSGLKGDADLELAGSRDSFLKKVSAKLVGSRRIEFRRGNDVLPAEEFTAADGENEYTVLTIIDDGRPYQLAAVIPKDESAEAAADVRQYFASFKIAPK